MSKMRLKWFFIIVTLLSVAITSCKNKQPFTPRGWKEGDGLDYPKRYMMVDDLLATRKLKGMTYKQVVQLLSSPQRNSHTDKSFYYDITLKVDTNMDTTYFKGLLFKLDADSMVTDVQVFEKTVKKKEKK